MVVVSAAAPAAASGAAGAVPLLGSKERVKQVSEDNGRLKLHVRYRYAAVALITPTTEHEELRLFLAVPFDPFRRHARGGGLCI